MGCVIWPAEHFTHGERTPQANGVVPAMIRVARESRGLTRAQLGKRLGLGEREVLALEMGIHDLGVAQYTQVCEVLDYPPAFFTQTDFFEQVETFGPVFLCGDGLHGDDLKGCGRCGRLATHLCDYPTGEGKTCDLPLCEGCRVEQGELIDLGYCPQHALIALGLVTAHAALVAETSGRRRR